MPFKLNRVAPMFSSPLAIFEVGGAEALNAALLKEIGARRKAEDGVQRSNRQGWHSESDFFQRKEPAHRKLAEEILGMAAEATRQVAPGQDLGRLEATTEGWVNINVPGSYNTPHDHYGAFWSGTYYVRVPPSVSGQPDAGAIEFLDHRGTTRYATLLPSPTTADKVVLKPQAGMCLMFPGTVRHWVHPHDGADDRVSIAFNIFYRPRG